MSIEFLGKLLSGERIGFDVLAAASEVDARWMHDNGRIPRTARPFQGGAVEGDLYGRDDVTGLSRAKFSANPVIRDPATRRSVVAARREVARITSIADGSLEMAVTRKARWSQRSRAPRSNTRGLGF